MSISRADVEHVARLAHLDPDPGTLERMTRELGAILDYMARLADAEAEVEAEAGEGASAAEATVAAGPEATPLREDTMRPGLPPGRATEAAPNVAGDLFRVPPAIGGDAQGG